MTTTTTAAVELPCTVCGLAAVEMNVAGLLAIVPAKLLVAIKGAARFSGSAIDATSPTLGLDAAEISKILSVTCVDCVDERDALAESAGDEPEFFVEECTDCDPDGDACVMCAMRSAGSGVDRTLPLFPHPE